MSHFKLQKLNGVSKTVLNVCILDVLNHVEF